ncbi:hypothetical protein [Streptomyces sp. NBC_01637]|uniref:hypothetical protein n=1 Tax=unclassified Streptomyces TaxID=2593676 RepID=UPI0038646968|nr:extracellular solute-binding protein [Streptomyces sp. NBC_01653]WTD87498.1 extracellular solute-binding protein [Streptomyces sp. NBC_01637]
MQANRTGWETAGTPSCPASPGWCPPCLAQLGYESLPSFAAAGALENVAKYANAAKGKYVDWTLKAVSVQDQVYGIPLDTGPEAMFHRADVLKNFKQPVPTTWKQFA